MLIVTSFCSSLRLLKRYTSKTTWVLNYTISYATILLRDTLPVAYATLLDDYVQPMLIHWAMVEYLPHAAYTIGNGGAYKHTAENSIAMEKEEVDFLTNKHRDIAEHYTRRFIDFMSFNQSTYPEYNTNNNDDIYPDKDAVFNGWQL